MSTHTRTGAQLRLVTEPPPGFQNRPLAAQNGDPVRQVFEHWVAMFGLSIRRCKLGPTRREAIGAALAMGYEVDDLLLAIEGHAADPMEYMRDADARRACRDLDWLCAREKRIEAAIDRGEALRREAQAQERRQAAAAAQGEAGDGAPPVRDPAAVAAERAKLAALAARLRGAA